MGIRAATPGDAAAIAAIYAPIVETTPISFEIEPPDAGEMARRIAVTGETHPYLVAETAAETGGTVLGYAYAGPHRARAAYATSVDVTAYVHETARGRGIGRALYEALLADLKRGGWHAAFAGITLPNARSVALHEAVGFSHLGTYREVGRKFDRWYDVGWWQRRL
ncbi:MAG: arsinothricin resistance N-acetyltransferase ArsN1 family B [Pseudomonadota bacterium]